MNTETPDPEIEGYNKKHERIRGTHELKYPPKVFRCKLTCGTLHYEIEVQRRKEYREHPCFLAIGHEGLCEFSSECVLLAGEIAA